MGHPKAAHVHGSLTAVGLSKRTWLDFERLFASNGGVWGGCWCMFYHSPGAFDPKAYERNKDAKRSLVERGRAHGVIVHCGGEPAAWCQFGPREELARIDKKRGYAPTAQDPWRITCLFVAPGHRRSGLARFAVDESLKVMAKLGAKTVEAYPVEGESNASFLWAGTPHLFEGAGFTKISRLGKKSWICSRKMSAVGNSR